ncbi:MAG: hypothetical protein J0M07_05925 [Anaerolineae bacterium]|jgi:hypothetical protein|uniref:hypothetical protein n=1 Tax=Candidatus Flexifilum breve TaxID=3140694 RepID=UPI001AD29992|nr:hypothetical protein [Chloroflexota bacterium]MBK9750584.1 hypothetical protein [Chloroflexota bacterium]MBN8634844.1 hypothetical protein [Anaerolineae bacterium]
MRGTWIKYTPSDSTVEIFNIDNATRFRHVDTPHEAFVEVHADDAVHTITRMVDPEAYQIVLRYIQQTTGFEVG